VDRPGLAPSARARIAKRGAKFNGGGLRAPLQDIGAIECYQEYRARHGPAKRRELRDRGGPTDAAI